MNDPIIFVGISGSLRTGSYNTKLLHAALGLLPEGVTMEIAGFAEIPVYNGDLDVPQVPERPHAVVMLREKIAKADGLFIVSPEYNYSIPGGLKNAIDWVSRGADTPLLRKPVALIGASTGMFGTVRMQIAFLPLFQGLDMKPVFWPEVMVAQAQHKFDAEGKLTDDKAREQVRKKLQALKDLVIQVRGK